MKKLGVIVARLQTSMIHAGHASLITLAIGKNDNVLIILGESPAKLTFTNPLSFEQRKVMIEDAFYAYKDRIKILRLMDCKSDKTWSWDLDHLIYDNCHPDNEIHDITIYGGRNGFVKYYSGEIRTEEVTFGIDNISASEIRGHIHHRIKNSSDWREGIIYASESRYPVSYQTVDIAIINHEKQEILLGKKKGENGFRFIGGFVDVDDDSLEAAARREVFEECGLLMGDLEYIGSFRIDDWRYRKDKDKIMTALFCCKYTEGIPKANDDIKFVEWIPMDKLHETPFEKEHEPLKEAVLSNYLIKTIK